MTATPAAVSLRRMVAADLPAALQLTQKQHWSHQVHDWQLHYELGSGWVACDAAGKLIGTTLWWDYGATCGCIGLVVVSNEHQGLGIGRQLMNAAIAAAGPRTLQLVATNAGLTLYEQCGFRPVGAIAQHQGVPVAHAAVAPAPGLRLQAVTADDLPALRALDAAAYGADRGAVLAALLPLGKGVLAQRDGRVLGFALQRPAGAGTTIGPVIASDQQLAMALIAHQLRASAAIARVDAPTFATELAQWLAGVGLPCVDRVTLMVRGTPVQTRGDALVLGLVSQALG
jgi:predicted N-acetyltransferase YhbS